MARAFIVGLCNELWCLMGDFNVVRWIEDRLNATRADRSTKKFNRFIAVNGLTDPPMANGRFSWSRMGERSAASRIDRFLLSNQWVETFKEYKLERLHRPTSDHFSIALNMGAFKWGPMPFRFENMWLEDPSFKSNVEQWWKEQSPVGPVSDLWRN